jgi:DHA1 family bicyclomycin/chloramphenicol resistance-like MFS transporter
MIFLIYRFLAESLPAPQSLHPLVIARNFGQLMTDPNYLAATTTSGLIYAGLLTYLSCSSFVFIDMYGVPSQYFGLIFLTSVIGYMVGSALSARLSRSHSSEYIVFWGSVLTVVATLLTLVGWLLFPGVTLALVLPMVFYSTGLGLVLPHAMAVALKPFPHIAGTAAALLGFIQMTLSASATALVGLALKDTPAPMIMTMILISAAALLLAVPVYRRHRSSQH